MGTVRGAIKDFKAFALRGNVLDLAVAVVIGTAFSAVVSTFTEGVLMALIAAFVGEPNFDAVVWSVGDGEIAIGRFLTAVTTFLLVAASLFLVLRAVARVRRPDPEPVAEAPAPSDEVVLLTSIRDLLAAGGTKPAVPRNREDRDRG